MIDTKELRQLVQAATPGPWFSDRRGNIWRRPLSDLYENGGGVAGDKPLAFVAAGWAGEGVTGYPVEANARFIAAANPAAITELLDRLEAAEADALEQARLNGMGSEREAALMAKLEAAEKERDECNRRRLEAADHFAAQTALMKQQYDDLRVKIAEMERQEPVATVIKEGDSRYWMSERLWTFPNGKYPLYALPGAKGETK